MISQYWYGYWRSALQVTNHYPTQCRHHNNTAFLFRFDTMKQNCKLFDNDKTAPTHGFIHSRLPPTAPPPDLRRPKRVLQFRHEKLCNYVTWPAWENWNVYQFNCCLYSSKISYCKSPWSYKCTTIFCFYNPDLPDAIICQSWICQQ